MPIFSFNIYTIILYQYVSLTFIGRLGIHFNHKVILILYLLKYSPLPSQLIRVTRERLYCLPDAECDQIIYPCSPQQDTVEGMPSDTVPVTMGPASIRGTLSPGSICPASPIPPPEMFCLLPLSPALISAGCSYQCHSTTNPRSTFPLFFSCLLVLFPLTPKVITQVVFSNRITGFPIPHALSAMCH